MFISVLFNSKGLASRIETFPQLAREPDVAKKFEKNLKLSVQLDH